MQPGETRAGVLLLVAEWSAMMVVMVMMMTVVVEPPAGGPLAGLWLVVPSAHRGRRAEKREAAVGLPN